LAMWAAARSRLPSDSEVHVPTPLRVRGVLNLAGPVDLTLDMRGYEILCRDTVITGLLGGAPAEVPHRYSQASASMRLPIGIPQALLIGEHEDFVPRPQAEAYVRVAKESGDPAQLLVIPNVGHFEIASPYASTWPRVASVIRSLLEGKLP
jgi:pimeloyl-ACP methyl ester carboxylesterase